MVFASAGVARPAEGQNSAYSASSRALLQAIRLILQGESLDYAVRSGTRNAKHGA